MENWDIIFRGDNTTSMLLCEAGMTVSSQTETMEKWTCRALQNLTLSQQQSSMLNNGIVPSSLQKGMKSTDGSVAASLTMSL